MLFRKKAEMPRPEDMPPGRDQKLPVAERHFVLDAPLLPPFPEKLELGLFGMGCFWGAERKFWEVSGIYSTSVGYAAGGTQNPSYEEVCSGLTGHNEVVRVVFDPATIAYEGLLKIFWENHDPSQGMQQGNDVGTQYRSGIYVADDAQRAAAEATRDAFAPLLAAAHFDPITTEIVEAPEFFYAEEYHQQYFAKRGIASCHFEVKAPSSA